MPTTAEAWGALVTAMETTQPSCDGWDVFTADRLSDEDAARCRDVCNSCPLLELCADYANRARPAAGFWAGRQRTGRT